MAVLNLDTNDVAELKRIKDYLEQFCENHPDLAEKINNGYTTFYDVNKENVTLLCKKNLLGCWKYCTEKARALYDLQRKASPDKMSVTNGVFVDDNTCYSWAVTYFEENDIKPEIYNKTGELFNVDGSEFKYEPPKPEKKPAKKEKKEWQLPLTVMVKDGESSEKPVEKPEVQTFSSKKKKQSDDSQIGFDFDTLFGEDKE